MKVVLQRVKEAQVAVAGCVAGKISKGVVVFLGLGHGDLLADIDSMTEKIVNLRIFDDDKGKMNLSAKEVNAEFLVVSQFTLLGECVKGRRPSFEKAAAPPAAEILYNQFVEKLRQQNVKVETGKFQAMMEVSLVNDGPVTFILESRNGKIC